MGPLSGRTGLLHDVIARAAGALALAATLIAPCPACAQELLLLGGGTRASAVDDKTYGWGLEYAHALGEHAYATLSWLNEGHVPDHHRDGQAAQIWARTLLMERRLALAAGIGPYRYFDTVPAAQGARYKDDHGWGVIFSVSATWYSGQRWLLQLRANRTEAAGSFDSTALLFGIGYQLEAPSMPGPVSSAAVHSGNTTNNELAVFAGRSILNSFGSEGVNAWALEYRHGLTPYLDWTLGWINEGESELLRRNGITTQLWLVRPFVGDRLVLGAGIGPYIAVDRHAQSASGTEESDRVSALVTFTGSYRFGPRTFARVSWNRVMTEYSRDSDVVLFGAGVRF